MNLKFDDYGAKMNKLLTIGGGSWGTAFSHYLTQKINPVKIWIREKEVIATINEKHENELFLPNIKLSEALVPVSDLKNNIIDSDIIILAIPSKYMRFVLSDIKNEIADKIIVNLSKGFEADSLKTISQIASDVLGEDILNKWVTISGPSFARELATNHPTAVSAVSSNNDILQEIQELFSSDILRLYRSDDLIGVEVAGSMKNVMAIAAGIISGLGFGYNSVAAMITRAIMEITRFGLKLGAKQTTFWGLAGIGDLMLTSFGPLSRNYQLGVKIAKGESLEDIENSSKMVVEGVETTKAIKRLSEQIGIEMPITNKVYEVLFDKKAPIIAIKELMRRSLKTEWNIN